MFSSLRFPSLVIIISQMIPYIHWPLELCKWRLWPLLACVTYWPSYQQSSISSDLAVRLGQILAELAVLRPRQAGFYSLRPLFNYTWQERKVNTVK